MARKKLLAAGLGLFAGAVLMAGSANAASVASSILINQLNQWSDNSAESQGVDANGDQFLDVGDTLRGTFQIETREDLTPPNSGQFVYGAVGNPSTNTELTGFFEIVVVSRTKVDNGVNGIPGDADDRYNFVFGAYAPFQNGLDGLPGTADDLSGTTMAVFYEDATPDYDRTGSIATAEAGATDGTKVLEIGFTGDLDESWNAINAAQSPALGATRPQTTSLGTFDFALGILFNTLFVGSAGVNPACFPLCPGDNLVDFVGSGGISGTLGSGAENDIFDNVDMVFRPIPEPGSLGMLGLGLLGLGAFLRMRKKAA